MEKIKALILKRKMRISPVDGAYFVVIFSFVVGACYVFYSMHGVPISSENYRQALLDLGIQLLGTSMGGFIAIFVAIGIIRLESKNARSKEQSEAILRVFSEVERVSKVLKRERSYAKYLRISPECMNFILKLDCLSIQEKGLWIGWNNCLSAFQENEIVYLKKKSAFINTIFTVVSEYIGDGIHGSYYHDLLLHSLSSIEEEFRKTTRLK